MWNYRRKLTISLFSFSIRNNLSSTASTVRTTQFLSQFVNPFIPYSIPLLTDHSNSMRFCDFPIFFSSVTSSHFGNSDNESCDDEESLVLSKDSIKRCDLEREIGVILDIIRAPRKSCSLVRSKLEECGIAASHELVVEILSRVRNDWEAAFTFFVWAGKQPNYRHSLREYHSMISILGKMRKFDTAWTLIEEMRGVKNKTGESIVTPQTLLIMIRRYCAVHDVGKAISTFYAHKRFKFEIRMEEFQNFLSALCRYKNVKDAEHLLFCNKDVFPLNTKSFNIILNGWCNIIGSPREGKRIWREMCEGGISQDIVSYASIISCYSKASEIREVIKLFYELKALGIAPDRKVYNAVIHALAKAKLVLKARNLMKLMEEKGIAPNAITYNSLIMPLCKAQQLDKAREAFNEMLQQGLFPTVRTYHAFFHILRTAAEVFALLEKMNQMGCHPSHDTYIMLIRKFCRWRQLDNVFKLWAEMSKNGLDPDRSSYVALIHGLFLNGMLEEAYKYYQEMKDKNLLPEPKLDERLQVWLSGRHSPELGMTEIKPNQAECSQSASKIRVKDERDVGQRPEIRRVVRERGNSFAE